MMKGKFFLFFLFLSFSSLFATEGKEIAEIQVRYLQKDAQIDDKRILSYVSLKEGDIYRQQQLDEDLKRLYKSGLVSSANFLINKLDDKQVKLILEVRLERKIREIKFQGNQKISSKRLKSAVNFTPQSFLDPLWLASAKEIILDLYQKAGYADAQVFIQTKPISKNEVICLFIVAENKWVWIKDIRFKGNQNFKSKKLSQLFLTKEKGVFSFLTKSGRVHRGHLKEDKNRIAQFYKNQGFLNFKLKELKFVPRKNGLVDLVFVIDEGERFFVKKIDFPNQPKDLDLNFSEAIGKKFSINLLNYYKRSILRYYGTRGYASARIETKIKDLGGQNLAIAFRVNKGKVYQVGDIHITGNEITKDYVIRREITLKPGDLLNASELEVSRNRIRNIGYFDKVIANQISQEEEGIRDIDIFLQEVPTGSLSLGLAFNSVDNASISAQFAQSNFDLFDPWKFRGGGQRFVADFTLGADREDFQFSLIEPWFLGRKISLGGELYSKRWSFLSSIYDQDRVGGSIFLRLPVNSFSSLTYRLKLESLEIERDHTNVNLGDSFGKELGDFKRNSFAVEYVFDSRDSYLLPRTGHRYQIELESVGGFLGGDIDIYRFSARFSKYWVSGKDHILQFKTDWQLVDGMSSEDRVPIFDRTFLGGSKNMRGFDFNDVGPRDLGNDKVLGGEFSSFFGLEYTIPVLEDSFRLAVFTGVAWISNDNFNFSSNYRYIDGGIGCRLRTPFGPIAIDYAWPLDAGDEEADKGGQFNFYVNYNF